MAVKPTTCPSLPFFVPACKISMLQWFSSVYVHSKYHHSYIESKRLLLQCAKIIWENPWQEQWFCIHLLTIFGNLNICSMCTNQWLAVSYRYRIGKVSDIFFSIEESIGNIFKVSVSYREKNQNFNPVMILLDLYYVCPSLYDQTTQTSFVHALGTVTIYKLFLAERAYFLQLDGRIFFS